MTENYQIGKMLHFHKDFGNDLRVDVLNGNKKTQSSFSENIISCTKQVSFLRAVL